MSANNSYILYQTKNLVNNKIYIGVHKENGTNYLGSGNAIKQAIRKYGSKNFERVTLQNFDNAKDAYLKENQIVDNNFVNRKDTYNIRVGGRGGWSMKESSKIKLSKYSKNRTEEHLRKMSLAATGKKLSQETKNKISKLHKGSKRSVETKRAISKALSGRHLSNEHKSSISKNHGNLKGVIIEGLKYRSIMAASKVLPIEYATIHYRINSKNFVEYNYQ